MDYTREIAIERLLKCYRSSYNIHPDEDDRNPITARCDFLSIQGNMSFPKRQSFGLLIQKNSYIF